VAYPRSLARRPHSHDIVSSYWQLGTPGQVIYALQNPGRDIAGARWRAIFRGLGVHDVVANRSAAESAQYDQATFVRVDRATSPRA